MREDEIYKEIEKRRAEKPSPYRKDNGKITIFWAVAGIIAIAVGGLWAGMQGW